MRNYTDDGKHHYDASTDENITKKTIKFEVQGKKIELDLLIPAKILSCLGSHDFDELVLAMRQRSSAIFKGVPKAPFVEEGRLHMLLVKESCEFLYQRFIFAQARAGNDVWAASSTMTDIGTRPEEDEKYVNSEGVIEYVQ